jgi:hypothetical protein
MDLLNPKTWADELSVVYGAPLIVGSLMLSTAVVTWWLRSITLSGQIKVMEQRLELAKDRVAYSDKKEIDLTKAIERQKAKKAAAVSKLKAAVTAAEADAAVVDLESANDTSAEVDAALTELKEANDSVEEALTGKPSRRNHEAHGARPSR